MSLRDERAEFSKHISELVLWFVEKFVDCQIAYDEVSVHSPRAARRGVERLMVDDAVHIPASFHHSGRAADLLVWRDGQYVADGDDPTYLALGGKWKSLDPRCTWGGDFPRKDSNHFSFGER
jgi:hypothetical protein